MTNQETRSPLLARRGVPIGESSSGLHIEIEDYCAERRRQRAEEERAFVAWTRQVAALWWGRDQSPTG